MITLFLLRYFGVWKLGAKSTPIQYDEISYRHNHSIILPVTGYNDKHDIVIAGGTLYTDPHENSKLESFFWNEHNENFSSDF